MLAHLASRYFDPEKYSGVTVTDEMAEKDYTMLVLKWA